METEIGNAAGVVWRHLSEHGPMTVTQLKQATGLSDQLVLMALGWLAREEKLDFSRDRRTMKITLKAA